MSDRTQSHITLMLGNVNEGKPVIQTRRSWKRVSILGNFVMYQIEH